MSNGSEKNSFAVMNRDSLKAMTGKKYSSDPDERERQFAKGAEGEGKVSGRIAVITGGAMGFGAGIASSLIGEGANVVIADINQEEGSMFAQELNMRCGKNRAAFVRTNVADPESVRALITSTVGAFGGLDAVIDTTKRLPEIPGGKKLIYINISLPLTAIDDFEKPGRIDPCFRELHKMLKANDFIWSSEAEKFLLEHARPV